LSIDTILYNFKDCVSVKRYFFIREKSKKLIFSVNAYWVNELGDST
jgi:hypothetical protein